MLYLHILIILTFFNVDCVVDPILKGSHTTNWKVLADDATSILPVEFGKITLPLRGVEWVHGLFLFPLILGKM